MGAGVYGKERVGGEGEEGGAPYPLSEGGFQDPRLCLLPAFATGEKSEGGTAPYHPWCLDTFPYKHREGGASMA